jgi:hypothetical protein
VRELDDTARTVRPALRQATPLLRAARPLSDQLSGALALLRPASQEGAKVIRGMDPTLTRLKDPLIPWLKAKNEIGLANYQSIGPVASATDSAASQFTALGHVMRFQGFAGGERSLGLPCATYFADPSAIERIRCDDLATIFQGVFDGAGPFPTKSSKKGR